MGPYVPLTYPIGIKSPYVRTFGGGGGGAREYLKGPCKYYFRPEEALPKPYVALCGYGGYLAQFNQATKKMLASEALKVNLPVASAFREKKKKKKRMREDSTVTLCVEASGLGP